MPHAWIAWNGAWRWVAPQPRPGVSRPLVGHPRGTHAPGGFRPPRTHLTRSWQVTTPGPAAVTRSGVMPVRVAPTGVTPVRVTPTGVMPVRVTPTGVTPVKVTPSGAAPVRVTPTGVTPVRVTPSGAAPA